MKEDNAEIATMERQIGEVQDQMRRVQEELQQLDQVRPVVSQWNGSEKLHWGMILLTFCEFCDSTASKSFTVGWPVDSDSLND